MMKFTSPLNDLKVASPCEESWDAMLGNERKRYCGKCELNVYNLSGMSAAEAENLLLNSEGRVCVRFFRRADGSIITQNCPVGWAKVKNRAKVMTTAAFSLILSLFSGLMFASLSGNAKFFPKIPVISDTPGQTMGVVSAEPYINKQPDKKNYEVMGNVALPKNQSEMGQIVKPLNPETKRKILAGK